MSFAIWGSASARRVFGIIGLVSGWSGGAVHTAPKGRGQRPRRAGSALQVRHLLDPPRVAAALERRLEEGLHDRGADAEAEDALADAEHVRVVVGARRSGVELGRAVRGA